jgi:hypothetical protein
MKSFRDTLNQAGFANVPVSTRGLALQLGVNPPISLNHVMDDVLQGLLNHKVERLSGLSENGVWLTNTDNPEIRITIRLINVHADWAKGDVPQELSRFVDERRPVDGWTINNGDFHLLVSDGEEEATRLPSRAGSLDGTDFVWPVSEGEFSGNDNAVVTVVGRVRVGYKPLTIRLGVSLPKPGFAANSTKSFRIALNPDVLLVPVEVVGFSSPMAPLDDVTAENQMMLWDGVPFINPNINFRETDGTTGETKFITRAWTKWPTTDSDGRYFHQGVISPDSIWGNAKVAFRLVNFLMIQTDDEHANPTDNSVEDAVLFENRDTVFAHPKHIEGVLTVIIMPHIVPPDFRFGEIGKGNLGHNALGISWADRRKGTPATLAHEIGHVMQLPHTTLANNVMNPPGGTDITSGQAEVAREWAKQFRSFWQRP